jgi:hypothetical protein
VPDDRARQLAREWIAAADRQLELAAIAFDRQLWNEAVALSAAATERVLKAMLTSTNQHVGRVVGLLTMDNVGEFVAIRPRSAAPRNRTAGRVGTSGWPNTPRNRVMCRWVGAATRQKHAPWQDFPLEPMPRVHDPPPRC